MPTARFIARFNLVFAFICVVYASILYYFAHGSRGFAQVGIATGNAVGTLYSAGHYEALRDSALSCYRLATAAMDAKAVTLEGNAALFLLVAVVLVWNFLAVRRLGA